MQLYINNHPNEHSAKITSNTFKHFSMNNKITLLAFAAVISFSACKTTYKNSQTPDDVYYSPVKEMAGEKEEEYKNTDPEEREIRMASHDRRWRDMDDRYDYDCNHHPYKYGYGYGYYYNPYYYPYPVYSPYIKFSNPKNSTPRMVNLGGYTPQTVTIRDPKTGQYQSPGNSRIYNTSNSAGNRRVINSRGNRVDYGGNDSRTYSPSSGSSGSSSSGNNSGGSRPVSRPNRN